MLGQSSSFAKEKMNQKGDTDKLGLSTGQGKILMLVGAILYKEYLNSPVLFTIDETLANLDTETTKLICNLIKDIFSDSIVISVDHQYGSNSIYDGNIVDIEQYIPQVLGETQEVT